MTYSLNHVPVTSHGDRLTPWSVLVCGAVAGERMGIINLSSYERGLSLFASALAPCVALLHPLVRVSAGIPHHIALQFASRARCLQCGG